MQCAHGFRRGNELLPCEKLLFSAEKQDCAVILAEIRRKRQVRQPYCNLYHYAGNNSVKYTDPDGRWVQFVIGAVAGGILGCVAAAIDSYHEDGSITWKRVAVGTGGGAVSGLVAATGIGLVKTHFKL